MISIQNLSKCFERENLFENVNLVFHSGDRVALVGKNGSGKTTFLKCLVGVEDFDGRVMIQEAKISLMEQEQNFSDLDKTFEEYLSEKVLSVNKAIKTIENLLGDQEVCRNPERFSSLMDRYNLLLTDQSLSVEQDKIKSILESLGIKSEVLAQKIKTLSGGQKTKLRLAECLAKEADIYLLDEPTNNLDLETREWLEKYLNKNVKSLMVISHDRYFLSKTVNQVWDLENKKIKKWSMGFDDYLIEKKKYVLNLEKDYLHAMKMKKQKLESAAEKRLWASKAGNRTKRIIADRLEREAKRFDEVENPFDFIKEIKIGFGEEKLHNCTIFRMENVCKKFDKVLFEDVNQEIDSGERVCIIGRNGFGKSTLLKLLVGEESPTSGTVFRRPGIKIGYFEQDLKSVNPELTLFDFILNESKESEENVMSSLVGFGFSKDNFSKKIKYLSGGEKARLNILRITLSKCSVLVLDEPTNNLDIYLVESLEEALKRFDGTIVFVSHDRRFVDNVATRIFKIDNLGINSFRGNYTGYIEMNE